MGEGPQKFVDRVKSLRRVKASDLRANPANFRRHPDEQRAALGGILSEVGFAGAVLARELPDGSLEILDGHCRVEEAGDQKVPVLVLDLDEEESNLLLASYDAIGAMATIDYAALDALVAELEPKAEALAELLASLTNSPALLDELGNNPLPQTGDAGVDNVPTMHCVITECPSEVQQRHLLEKLTKDGWKCRALG